LSLPVEIRLQIYNLLLVSRVDAVRKPLVDTYQQKIILYPMVHRFSFRIDPSILRTCKQVYHEANPILYSQNIFQMKFRDDMFRFIGRVGPVNLKLIRKLEIEVYWASTNALSSWLDLLHVLAEEAGGLRYIKLTYDAIPPQKRGLGDNLDFVRAFGKIQGLETLVLEGFYAKNWPAYLEERMGVRVQTIHQRPDEHEMRLRGDPEYHIKFVLEADADHLPYLMEYQQGTENLIP
jgi:hypothetical protein